MMPARRIALAALGCAIGCIVDSGLSEAYPRRPPGDPDRVDFSNVPAARSVEESKLRFDARAAVLAEYWAQGPLGAFNEREAVHFQNAALAKLIAGHQIRQVNEFLLSPDHAYVYSNVGTGFDFAGPLCKRRGDYDFMLQGLVRLMYELQGSPAKLWPRTRQRILGDLLNTRGNRHRTRLKLWKGACGTFEETENHILMTESSRYLTNQLLLDEARERDEPAEWFLDNDQNGFEDWMTAHLQRFLVRDFSEYNAKPYQGYSVLAIQNLHSYARGERVATGAELVLDFLAAKFAVQSHGLRRAAPFRRQPKYRLVTELFRGDAESARYAVLAGNYERFAELTEPMVAEYGGHFMMAASVGRYRVPDPILDLMIDKSGSRYFQRFRHQGVEIYYSSPRYLLTAGGIFVDRLDLKTGQNDGWAMPTTLMPAAAGVDRKDFIRFEGNFVKDRRANTCVAPRFACGLKPVVPDSIPESCRTRSGNWTFFDFTSGACPLKHGYYVALYRQRCDTQLCFLEAESSTSRGEFGFMEVSEPEESGSFAAFRDGVLARARGSKYGSENDNRHVTAAGDAIVFRPLSDLKTWAIREINGKRQETRFKRWPLAQGDVLDSPEKGLVRFTHPRTRETITLDYRDAYRPRKSAGRRP